MSLQSRVAGRLAQLRVAGQLLVAPRPRPGPSAGATRPHHSACSPPASLGGCGPRARTSAGVGARGAAAVGQRAGVRTWAPLAMAAKVDLSTSTDWKAAKSFLKGLSDKQREEHYFCRDFVRLKKIPTWKEMAKGVAVKVEEPKYKKDKHLNEKISLFRGDITKLEVDAIVNAEWYSHVVVFLPPPPGAGAQGCMRSVLGNFGWDWAPVSPSPQVWLSSARPPLLAPPGNLGPAPHPLTDNVGPAPHPLTDNVGPAPHPSPTTLAPPLAPHRQPWPRPSPPHRQRWPRPASGLGPAPRRRQRAAELVRLPAPPGGKSAGLLAK
ncbi:ADP-ribose glycohydrolase MACROD1 [Rhynchocyon petersi]